MYEKEVAHRAGDLSEAWERMVRSVIAKHHEIVRLKEVSAGDPRYGPNF
jgi:hypothetical protein